MADVTTTVVGADVPVIQSLGVPALYMDGMPKELRADCKAGQFNIKGKTTIGNSLTFQPVAYRFFTDDILGMGVKNWVELFFFDEKGHLCGLMFHGYSRENLESLASELFYDQKGLHEVILTATMKLKNSTKNKAKYYIADFTYEVAQQEQTEELQAWAVNRRFFRRDTYSPTMVMEAAHRYWMPDDHTQDVATEDANAKP